MCGIAGFFTQQWPENAEQLLVLMQQKLRHRGPDGGGIWLDRIDGVGFAHRRLSIQDLSERSAQPFISDDGTVVVIFNGEIYNHPALKKELEHAGDRYRSSGDTETIVKVYQRWGIEGLQRLEGMFAFALVDSKRKELYLVRDRIGIKPLYITTQGSAVGFASEIKALWCLPWVSREISEQVVGHYYTFMVAPAPMTVFRGVYKLPAGFYAKLFLTTGELTFHRWYSVLDCLREPITSAPASLDYYVEQVQEMLAGIVKRQMIADVPVGAFLSGGLDSSLIVALMQQSGGQLKTFNASFEGSPGHDERAWARRVAQQFGTEHHELVITERDAAGFFEQMVEQLDEPLADPVCMPFYFLSKAARAAGVPVVQVGEGADELFFGYPLYQRNMQAERRFGLLRRLLPRCVRLGVSQTLAPLCNQFRREWLFNWAHDRPLFWGGATVFGQQEKRALGFSDNWVDDEVVTKICGANFAADSVTIVNYHLDQLRRMVKQPDFVLQLSYLELAQRLPELLLMRADKMSMAEGIEVRVPFLDHRLVECALKMPVSVKCGSETKRVLKRAALRWLPHDLVYRNKVGFGVPLANWCGEGKLLPAVLATYQGQDGCSSVGDRYSMALRLWVRCQCQVIRCHQGGN